MRCTLLTRRSMALAINIMHGRGPSNERHTQLQPKKTKDWLLAFNMAVYTRCAAITRWSALILKCVILMLKHFKEDWFVVLKDKLQLEATLNHC